MVQKWLVAIILILNASTIFPGCSYFAAGSYPFAERYLIDTTEEAIVKAINTFKAQHPSFVAPKYLEDGRKDSSDHWYHVYFYLPEDSLILYCWTRPQSETETAVALVSINEGLGSGNWKDINKDFTSAENKKYLGIFQQRLLKPVMHILEK